MKYDSGFDLINTYFIVLISFLILCMGFDIPSFYFIAPLTFLCILLLSSILAYAILLPYAVFKDIERRMNEERKVDMYAFS